MGLVLRETKGAPLTHQEMDGNFQFLDSSISEATDDISMLIDAYDNVSGAVVVAMAKDEIPAAFSMFDLENFDLAQSTVVGMLSISGRAFAASVDGYGNYNVTDYFNGSRTIIVKVDVDGYGNKSVSYHGTSTDDTGDLFNGEILDFGMRPDAYGNFNADKCVYDVILKFISFDVAEIGFSANVSGYWNH